jgi:hypothetical protein
MLRYEHNAQDEAATTMRISAQDGGEQVKLHRTDAELSRGDPMGFLFE